MIEKGISPLESSNIIEHLRNRMQEIERVNSEIHNAYDAELHRLYGYDFCRPLPNGADSSEALRSARARLIEAVEDLVTASAVVLGKVKTT